MFVSDAMNRKPKTIEHNAPVEKAIRLMKKNRISSLIVTKNKKLAGILTTFDIFSSRKISSRKLFVRDAMKTEIIKVSSNDSLNYAASLMMRHKIQKLPVIDEEKLVGILTVSDLMSYQNQLESKVKNISELKKYMGVGF